MNACSLYTYRVTYVKHVNGLGDLPHGFRTTDDAVELWRADLARDLAAGRIVSFTITPIGAQA